MAKLYLVWALIVTGGYYYASANGIYWTSLFESRKWSKSGPGTFHHK